MPDLVRDLVVCLFPVLTVLVSPTEREADTFCNETFAGEYRLANHGRNCPTGNHFVRARLELLLYTALQTSPSYRPAS